MVVLTFDLCDQYICEHVSVSLCEKVKHSLLECPAVWWFILSHPVAFMSLLHSGCFSRPLSTSAASSTATPTATHSPSTSLSFKTVSLSPLLAPLKLWCPHIRAERVEHCFLVLGLFKSILKRMVWPVCTHDTFQCQNALLSQTNIKKKVQHRRLEWSQMTVI